MFMLYWEVNDESLLEQRQATLLDCQIEALDGDRFSCIKSGRILIQGLALEASQWREHHSHSSTFITDPRQPRRGNSGTG
jgi:hypothetical protein